MIEIRKISNWEGGGYFSKIWDFLQLRFKWTLRNGKYPPRAYSQVPNLRGGRHFHFFEILGGGEPLIRTPLIAFSKISEGGYLLLGPPPYNVFDKKFYNLNFQHAFSPIILNLQPSFTYQNTALTLLYIKDWVCHPW